MFRPRLVYRLEEMLEATATSRTSSTRRSRSTRCSVACIRSTRPLCSTGCGAIGPRTCTRLRATRPAARPSKITSSRCSSSTTARSRCVTLSRAAGRAERSHAWRSSASRNAPTNSSSRRRDRPAVRLDPGAPAAACSWLRSSRPRAPSRCRRSASRIFTPMTAFTRTSSPGSAPIAEQIEQERWVLGECGKQSAFGRAVQDPAAATSCDLYPRDFIAAWQRMLAKIRLKRFATDKTYVGPDRRGLADLADQAADRGDPRRDRGDRGRPSRTTPPSTAPKPEAPTPCRACCKKAPRARQIEDAFHGVPGHAGRRPRRVRPIDQLLKILGDIATDLKRQASNPSDRPQVNNDLAACRSPTCATSRRACRAPSRA